MMEKTVPMKRALTLFLAAVMAAALLVCPAAAASAPWVQIEGKSSNSQEITIQGLSQRYTSVQITFTLSSVHDSISFQSAFSDAQAYSTFRREGTSVTVYLTSNSILNQGDSLPLGTLTANEAFTIVSVSGLKLLNVGPNDTVSLIYDAVRMDDGSVPQPPDPTPPRYSVAAASGISGGSLHISTSHARRGQTVTVTAVPDAGYTLSSLTVTDNAGRSVSVTELGNGKWSFSMPSSAVTVSAAFVPDQPMEPLPFSDVGEDDWFWESVDYVYRAGLMSGTSSTTFSPSSATTRGMVVTILHRYEGSPAADPSSFQDVPPAQYYAGAVSWAAANGVVNGYDGGLFKPDQMITREQMAAILFRYAQYKGIDVSGKADLSGYSDTGDISGYAVEAMAWANHAGLITGMEDHTLRPQGFATRAQVATILMRFCSSIAQQ